MIKITDVKKDSIAEQSGIRKNDVLVSLNNHDINDFLDYLFYQSEEHLSIEFEQLHQRKEVIVEKSFDEDLGLKFQEMRIRSCSNNCIFCFIRQNPPKMRRQIYFCDEDYRYSFLYGNYITLTDISDADLRRISEQRLSPLYISVHATDPDVRKAIFRFRSDDDRLMEKIDYLVKNRIELHTQVVLVPGLNDGEVLEKTIRDLYRFKNGLKTVAIVPVGLTMHRKRLPVIQPVTPDLAGMLIEQSQRWDRDLRNNEGDPFVYLADEIYLLAKAAIPETEHYGPFYQIENGVGLCRQLLDSIGSVRKANLKITGKFCFITGKLAEPLLHEKILPKFNQQKNLNVQLVAIENNFFGTSVTVSGLITGRDIIDQFPKNSDYNCIFLPPNCINDNGLLLDDVTPDEIAEAIGVPVKVGFYDMEEMVNQFEE